MAGQVNGRATLRDVMELQKESNKTTQAIWKEITNLKIKVYVISGGVSLAVSIIAFIFMLVRLQNIIKSIAR